uniref:maleylacetoacetate isomerase n=1 Tax=Romanomermis culicivorax TaxID=13658 RepID=A0A915HMP0_ROMCU
MSPTKLDPLRCILYTYWRSSCSWRVRAALEYKNLPYEMKPVDLLGTYLHSDEFKALNPAEYVPVLVVNGHRLTESLEGRPYIFQLAIMEYLEDMQAQPNLLPKDAADKAKVRAISLHIVSGIQPLQNASVLKFVGDDRKLEFAQHFIRRGFIGLEKMLKTTSGEYCFGDQLTMADFCLVPQVYNAVRFKVDMNEFPTIKKINDALMKLDIFKKTHPSNQPDTPAGEKMC